MYILHPGSVKSVSIMDAADTGIMIGTGADSDIIAWYSNELSKWIAVDNQDYPLDCVISFNSDTLYPLGTSVHGYPAWVGTTYCIYYWGAWLAMPKAKLGYYEPDDDADYDWYYLASGDPYDATYAYKGTATANQAAVITSWARWESTTQYGVYTAAGGATGTQTIGLPDWTDPDETHYTRSLEKVDGYYTYGSLTYDAANALWILGSYGSAAGWHQTGSEPTPGSNVTLTFAYPSGADPVPAGSDITLTANGYTAGDNSTTSYIGEVAIWRS